MIPPISERAYTHASVRNRRLPVDPFSDENQSTGAMFIVWTFPDVPSLNTMFMLEAMTFKLAVAGEKSIVPSGVVAEAWTNVYHKDNPEGDWHSIPLDLISTELHHSPGQAEELTIATFGNSVMLTSDGKYSFTFRVKTKPHSREKHVDDSWTWAGGYEEDGVITVRPPSGDKWTKGPEYSHILGAVHLGNFMAASIADQLAFDAVLNVADSLDLVTSKFSKPVDYKKIPIRDGAMHHIPSEQIREAVEWLQDRSNTCNKILVNCRAGIGRAGSVVVAYVFAQTPDMSYEQAYNFVFSRRFVYPHKGLRDTLYRLYPRRN